MYVNLPLQLWILTLSVFSSNVPAPVVQSRERVAASRKGAGISNTSIFTLVSSLVAYEVLFERETLRLISMRWVVA